MLSGAVHARARSVTLPEGRVFFSCACWEGEAALPEGILDGAIDMPNGEAAGVVAGPRGTFLLSKGGLSIKRNDWRNLWGSLGDVMLILGRFSAAAPTTAGGAPPPRAAAAADAADAAGGGTDDDDAPVDALAAQRAELARREADLRAREEALRRAEEEQGDQ